MHCNDHELCLTFRPYQKGYVSGEINSGEINPRQQKMFRWSSTKGLTTSVFRGGSTKKG